MTFEELVAKLKKKTYNIHTNYPIKKYTLDDLRDAYQAGLETGISAMFGHASTGCSERLKDG